MCLALGSSVFSQAHLWRRRIEAMTSTAKKVEQDVVEPHYHFIASIRYDIINKAFWAPQYGNIAQKH